MLPDSPLGPFRALDLTDEKGFFCGKVLADLGADVIKIERPGGDPSRRLGPFFRDNPDPEKSLYWFAYNANKRGITLDIETADGRDILCKLVSTADFLIESFTPGHMDSLGLGYAALSKSRPGLIMTSITHFGSSGPYRDYKGCDIVDMAMGGYMFLCGDPDRPPVRISCPQAYLHAGLDAAAVTMIAFYHRQATGQGQWIDFSIQQALPRLMMIGRLFWETNHWLQTRGGAFENRIGVSGVTRRRQTWPCKEGFVTFLITGGHLAPTMHALAKWMDEEGMAPDFLTNMDWGNFDMARMSQDRLDQFSEPIGRFFMKHTAAELYQGAKERRIMLYPISTSRDITGNLQLSARDFWEDIEHPELGASIPGVGPFLKASETPIGTRHRAPLVGEHNAEVYGELGIPAGDQVALRESGVI